MNPVSSVPVGRGAAPGRSPPAALPDTHRPWWRSAVLPLALALLFCTSFLLPRVRANPNLVFAFALSAGGLFAWLAILAQRARAGGRRFEVRFLPPLKSHTVQTLVQFAIYAYWGWHWRELYAQAPLILAQLVFLTTFDALLSWSRGRSWIPGMGPFPIVLSTNFFLWFRDDWFVWQFVMVVAGALVKEFVRWERDGKRVHVFNPSAIGLTIASLVLIATGTTAEHTWARELASTIDEPAQIYVLIFLLGIVVQAFFSVTLMTLAAGAVLYVLNLVYTEVTGSYQFVTINISAAVFLGIHLLLTDPATSPRSNVGRAIFGGLYGLAIFLLYSVLDYHDAPVLYTKLLPVPLLNLAVPWIDRQVGSGALGRWNERWSRATTPRKLNLVHMSVWTALFATMLATGFVQAPHPGNSIPFWKRADTDGVRRAGKNVVLVALIQAGDDSPAANNEVGLICIEGRLIERNNATAARYFARASELGSLAGAANVAMQYLFLDERRSDADVARALAQLEQACAAGGGDLACFLLGVAHETGRGRPLDLERAALLVGRCSPGNLYAARGLARVALANGGGAVDLAAVAPVLEQACAQGDAESCWYLGYLHREGRVGGTRDEVAARAYVRKACELGSEPACAAGRAPRLPPYATPVIDVPPWVSEFPLP